MGREHHQPTDITVRPADRPGDLGWVVMAHGEIYDQQFGWNTDFEALVATIVADYALGHDGRQPGREPRPRLQTGHRVPGRNRSAGS